MKYSLTKIALTMCIVSHYSVYGQTLIWNETRPAGNVNRNWGAAAMSPDGMKMVVGDIVTGAAGTGRLFLSTNGGRSWSQTQPAGDVGRSWNCAAISSNGTKIIAGETNGRLFMSANGGSTWAEITPAAGANRIWTTVSMSADGSTIAAGYYGIDNSSTGNFYVSSDGGTIWTTANPGGDPQFWTASAVSADGTKILASYGTYSGKMYLSTNGGSSWTEQQPAGAVGRSWNSLSMSSDGTTFLAGVYDGNVYISRNGGTNWSQTLSSAMWRSTSISADGSKMVAGSDQNGRTYVSTNSGSSWSQNTPNGITDGNWKRVVINSDGSKAFVVNSSYRVYYYSMYPGAGSGTSGDPFQVSSLSCLSYICQNSGSWDKYFIQTANIDAAQTMYWDDADDDGDGNLYNDPNDATSTGNNEGWSPAGNWQWSFSGTYNGQGYTISNLKFTRSAADSAGFFGYSSGGAISNLGLRTLNITGQYYVGGLAGCGNGTSFTGCSVTGTVAAAGYVGGLGGEIDNAAVNKCYSTAAVSSTLGYGGGLLSRVSGATVTDSYATGSVSAPDKNTMGGFLAYLALGSTIDKCYSTGVVTGTGDNVGGFLGGNSGTDGSGVTNSFWDVTTSGQSSSDGGTGKTTAEMKTMSTFTSAGWDVTGTIWKMDATTTINNGYPFLAWQNAGGSALPVELVSFTPAVNTRSVELTWQTATETNNYGFDVERQSVNGWSTVGFVEGHGTTNAPQSYTFTDTPGSGKFEYRLKQIDRNGKFAYSHTVEAYLAVPVAFGLEQNYPNPFNPTTNISFTLPVTGRARLTVFTVLGARVCELFNGTAEGGVRQTVSFDASQYASGVYVSRLESAGKLDVMKMQLIR